MKIDVIYFVRLMLLQTCMYILSLTPFFAMQSTILTCHVNVLSLLHVIFVQSHADAGTFMYRSFPYLDEFTLIYGKDRANGEDAQTAADVVEEMEREEQTGQNMTADMPMEEQANDGSQRQSVARTSTKKEEVDPCRQ